MLVLTRKLQEQIRIGQDVVITVLEFRGNAIRLGIEAPKHVKIMRGELPQRETASPAGMPATPDQTAGKTDYIQVIELRLDGGTMVSSQPTTTGKPVFSQPATARHPLPTGSERRSVRGPLADRLNGRREQQSPAPSCDEQSTGENSSDDYPAGNVFPAPETDLLGEEHLLAVRSDSLWNAV